MAVLLSVNTMFPILFQPIRYDESPPCNLGSQILVDWPESFRMLIVWCTISGILYWVPWLVTRPRSWALLQSCTSCIQKGYQMIWHAYPCFDISCLLLWNVILINLICHHDTKCSWNCSGMPWSDLTCLCLPMLLKCSSNCSGMPSSGGVTCSEVKPPWVRFLSFCGHDW